MAKKTQSIVVEQYHNSKFNDTLPKDRHTNPEFNYRVMQTTNTIVVNINEWLAAGRVQELIDQGINVTVKGIK